MSIPLGEYTTESTDPLWPAMTCRRAPVEVFHSRTVQSWEPDTSRSPSGEKATHIQLLECPSRTRIHGLHICSGPSLTAMLHCEFRPYTCDSRDSTGRNRITWWWSCKHAMLMVE